MNILCILRHAWSPWRVEWHSTKMVIVGKAFNVGQRVQERTCRRCGQAQTKVID